MSTRTIDGGAVRIDLGPLQCVDLRVVARPYLSIMGLMKEVLAHTPRGLPLALSRRIDGAVTTSGHRSMLPLADPRRTMAPSCLYPAEGLLPLGESIAALRDATSGDVADSIAENLGGGPPDGWQEPLRTPRLWMDSVARGAAEVAQAVAPDWRRAREAISREADRAQQSFENGTFDLFVASLSPRLALSGNVLSFDDPQPEDVALAGRTLVLVPMLAGPRMLTSGFDDPRFVKIGYPIPGFFHAPNETAGSCFDELLGKMRATLMLCVGRPRTVGDLALMLTLSPAAVTFQCDKLAASGLILRERVGQHVWISRSSRGEELIELMSRPAQSTNT